MYIILLLILTLPYKSLYLVVRKQNHHQLKHINQEKNFLQNFQILSQFQIFHELLLLMNYT